ETWRDYSEQLTKDKKDVYLAGVKDTAKYLQQGIGGNCDAACIEAAKLVPNFLSSNAAAYDLDGTKMPDWASMQKKIKLSSEMTAQGSAKDMSATVKWALRTDEGFSPTHLLIALGMICVTFLVVMVLLCRTAIAWKGKN